jgi:hypothetical protein
MLSLFLNEASGFRLGLATNDVPDRSPSEELLLDRLEDHLRANPAPDGKHPAVMVVGLEAAIDIHLVPPSQTFRGGPILRNANFHRDAYLRFCPAPSSSG